MDKINLRGRQFNIKKIDELNLAETDNLRKYIEFVSLLHLSSERKFLYKIYGNDFCLACNIQKLFESAIEFEKSKDLLIDIHERGLGLGYYLELVWKYLYLFNVCKVNKDNFLINAYNVLKIKNIKEEKFTSENCCKLLSVYINSFIIVCMDKILDIYEEFLYDMKKECKGKEYWILSYWLDHVLLFFERYVLFFDEKKNNGYLLIYKDKKDSDFSFCDEDLTFQINTRRKHKKKGKNNE